MKPIYLDTETGGFSHEHEDLLTASFIQDDTETNFKVSKRKYRTDPQGMAVNGIDLDYLYHSGETMPAIELKVGEILGQKDAVFIGHNINFDALFLAQLNSSFYHRIMRNHIDTKALALNLKLQGKLPADLSTSLKPLCEFFGIDTQGHHDALVDCRLTRSLLFRLNNL